MFSAQRYALIFIAMIVSSLGEAAFFDARAQTEIEMDRGSLRDLQPLYVSVYVEGTSELANHPGLDASSLHRVVDSTLTASGIPLNRTEPAHVIDREPFISVHVNAMDMGRGLIPFAIEIDIVQGVVVANVPNELIHAATWDTGLVGLVSEDKIGTIRWAVIELVEEFVEDYYSINTR